MKTKKPDIFLGITICMLVLAAALCIAILVIQKNADKKPTPVTPGTPGSTTEAVVDSGATGSQEGTGSTGATDTPAPVQPADLKAIDEAGLKAKLDDTIKGLTSEWQVMVTDPVKGTRVTSSVNCGVDDWMTANRMAQVFIMGAAYQQVADGKLKEADIQEDLTAMITQNDTYAADRLTDLVGGREAVKSFAVDNGVKLGFNRPITGSSDKKNYVSAQQTALLLDLICRGELVSKEASDKMLNLLLTPNDKLAIDPGLTGENLRYGFVTDIEDGICVCAMGVVQLPNRSFVISVVCNEPVTTDGAKAMITKLISATQPFFAE